MKRKTHLLLKTLPVLFLALFITPLISRSAPVEQPPRTEEECCASYEASKAALDKLVQSFNPNGGSFFNRETDVTQESRELFSLLYNGQNPVTNDYWVHVPECETRLSPAQRQQLIDALGPGLADISSWGTPPGRIIGNIRELLEATKILIREYTRESTLQLTKPNLCTRAERLASLLNNLQGNVNRLLGMLQDLEATTDSVVASARHLMPGICRSAPVARGSTSTQPRETFDNTGPHPLDEPMAALTAELQALSKSVASSRRPCASPAPCPCPLPRR